MSETELMKLGEIIFSDPGTIQVAKPGLCRKWTTRAIAVATRFREQSGLDFVIQAREVTIDYGLYHTFLRVLAAGVEPYVYDGVGVLKHGPFKGAESAAPHLSNSTPDLIHAFLLDSKP